MRGKLDISRPRVDLKTMKKIIHLTDPHLGYGNLTERFRLIVRNIIFAKEPSSNYVVVLTGDIVDDANDGYDEAMVAIQRLRNAGYTVLVCPGNHDYGTGSLAHRRYVKRFKEAFYESPDFEYPTLDIIGEDEDSIAFIGLDSMAEEVNWYDALWAQGELGDAQRQRLAALLEKETVKSAAKRVIYLHHHPFHPKPFHHLKDSEELGQVLKAAIEGGTKIDALLFGHNHDGHKWNGKWGISRVYDGGSATRKEGSYGPHRVIDLTKDPRFDYDGDFHAVKPGFYD